MEFLQKSILICKFELTLKYCFVSLSKMQEHVLCLLRIILISQCMIAEWPSVICVRNLLVIQQATLNQF